MRDFSRLDRLIQGFVEKGTNPGCAVAIMQGDEMIYHGEAGYVRAGVSLAVWVRFGNLGDFGRTGGTGIWVEADPVDHFSVAYMYNMRPNEELYHHHRVRAVVNGIML